MATLMQTCNWESIIEYQIIDNQVCKPVVSETWRSACPVRYIKCEYISMDTFVAMSASIIKLWMDFNNTCKNSKISHLDILKF